MRSSPESIDPTRNVRSAQRRMSAGYPIVLITSLVLLFAIMALPGGGDPPLDPIFHRTLLAAAAEEAEPPTARDHGPHDATSRHPFNEIKKWVRVFDDPARAKWQKPAEVVAALRLEPGMIVADLGAGTGYFVEHLARPVAPDGIVLAIDTEPEMVKYIGARAVRDRIANVVPVLAQTDDPFLPPGRVDRVLIVDTYHHIDDRLHYFGAMRRALTPGGRVVIVDFKKEPLPVGPPLEHKLSREYVIKEMKSAGWALDREESFLPHQYYLVFRNSK